MNGETSKTRRYALADLPLANLAARKRALGLTVAVIIPCRNEAATVGTILSQITASLYSGEAKPGLSGVAHADGLVDELIVMDDNSIDHTAEVASAAGDGAHLGPLGHRHLPQRDGDSALLEPRHARLESVPSRRDDCLRRRQRGADLEDVRPDGRRGRGVGPARSGHREQKDEREWTDIEH